ncbi:MAG TPA: hypothetical protein VFC47_02000 [Caulobacteraceae bacterium]|nr:hypothetical protein [Caulobacteraceae bacterium]
MAKPVTLRPVHPNCGVEAQYRRRLDAIIAEMHRSLVYFVSAAYRANEPEMAQDRSPAKELQAAMKRFANRRPRSV